ncbi:MAG: flagellar type III secretion system pore protein FliP [Proteobacteria bacterium]|nr:flagellar type III secretion system pore protein FliP [Pseudomonadota bacterium]
MKRVLTLLFGVAALAMPLLAAAAEAGGMPVLSVEAKGGTQTYSLTVQVLVLMTLLSVLPAILLSMTAFTRIVIVLSILRQALGTPQTPPNQVVVGLSLFMTLFVMSPVLNQAWSDGVKPYLDGQLAGEAALTKTVAPLREFMLKQTRESDLASFGRISGQGPFAGPEAVPMTVLVPAFITSELKTAFQIGFMIFIPFLIIDLVVASVLMSMGMMMLSPMLVSLPFKLMLFVLVDGWTLLMGTLASSFAT